MSAPGSGLHDLGFGQQRPFTPWLTNTTTTQATYTGVGGHTYGFYSISRDLVGNVEPAKSTAETTTLVNAAALLTVTTTSLPDGQTGLPYSQNLVATGGTLPYTWKVTGGRLPPGMVLNPSTGQLNGTPTNIGSSVITFTVTDSGSPAQTATVALTLTIAPPTLTVTTTSLPNGQVGVPFSKMLAATGGTAPYKWELTAGGGLPAGLTLDASTGLISGTPTAAVTNFRLIVRLTDSSTPPQIVSASFTLTITALGPQ